MRGSEKRRICTAVVRKYEEGAENRHPKVPKTLILWALPELERAKRSASKLSIKLLAKSMI
jgi:hypothetical protein